MRILIIGGGIAGTATALALHQAGFAVSVHEAHPDSAEDIGAFLTLADNGMRALAQIGAAETVTAVGFPLTTMRVLAADGDEVAEIPLGEADRPLSRFRCLRRSELNRALQAEAGRRGIALAHGVRLTALSDRPASVRATFSDGSTASGDLLIGADGINSTVRSSLDPGGAGPRYAGQRVYYGYCSGVLPGGDSERITMIRGSGAAFGCATSPSGETHWFARVSGPAATAAELAGGTPTRWRDLLLPLLRADATPAADLVAATDRRIMVTNACDLPPGAPWAEHRTLLIGDAAHAASPATGQGAAMALEDAVVLAKALRDYPGTATALAAYERLRRPRVERNTAASARITDGTAPPRPDPGRTPGPGAGGGGRPVTRVDPELLRQLDWDTPLTSV
ncbi:NAD(P)/FAD-dependent oxidoreductase [Streptacidiphilus sp. P02-A3a]|uniref:FAD-dependent oxidoreductase n=1 Tax=Streptacidiphilus sp. P02-A3a TaxID=2704468 RepID=UPI0015F89B5E|nr:FAD-dependent monooxygenase [Streptacidiphilus sp. P02-A3a]QMU70584.1 NAD(P)-binding protein [Streptacidiphilus sp. P02-A3a]